MKIKIFIYFNFVPVFMELPIRKTIELIQKRETPTKQCHGTSVRKKQRERALKGMKCGKAVGADEMPAEAWKCMGNFGIKMLCKLFNCIMNAEQCHRFGDKVGLY